MKNSNHKNPNYNTQVVFLVATITALLAVVVLGAVLIWNVLHRDSQVELPPVQTDPVTTTQSSQTEDTSVPDVTTASPVTTEPSDTTADPSVTDPAELHFKADLSAYEDAMNPQGETRDAFLLLVNPDHPLSKDYVPQNLTNVSDPRYDPPAQMVETAATALKAMFLEMKANGYTDVTVTSGYRSYSSQNYYFESYVDKEMKNNPSLTRAQAEAIVVTYSCRPGTSEHQSGLCCDMHNLRAADVSFAKQEVAQWLAQNSWKFGFVVRFPESKTNVTGISYEPWHFRYVGRYHAEKMFRNNMCLEEYVAAYQNGTV